MRPDELDPVLDFVGTDGTAPREYYQAIWQHSPGAKDEHSRVVFVDGVPVSHLRLHEREMRLGATVVRHGGVGDVGTHPDHRRRGYGRMLLEDAQEYFRAAGMDLAIIFSGVHHFYCNCGYEKCPAVTYKVRADRSVYGRWGGLRVRWFEPDRDLQAVSAVYDAYNASRPMSIVRGADHWRRQRLWSRRGHPEGFIVCELGRRGGELAAYARGGVGEIIEVGRTPGPDGEAALRQCIEAAMRLAVERGRDELSLVCPSDEPLLAELREKFEVAEEVKEATLVRFVDLPGLLGKLAGELTRRLAAAGSAPSGALAFSVAGGHEATLAIREGTVSARAGVGGGPDLLELSAREMLMLLSGMGMPEGKVPSRNAPILAALFPPAGPVYWPADVV